MTTNDQPFGDLPGALVEELMAQAEDVGHQYIAQLETLRAQREDIRAQMRDEGLLARQNDLPAAEEPTTCGVDGARITENLLAMDIVAIAAIAVEGLTPPSEQHHWGSPKFKPLFLQMERHHHLTNRVASGLMIAMELDLAVKAPHGVRFIDNSLATPVIQLNQALAASAEAPELTVTGALHKQLQAALESYRGILSNQRSDVAYVGVPKYNSNNEISEAIGLAENWNDRSLMTMVLEAGEYTVPRRLKKPGSPWHINTESVDPSYGHDLQKLADDSCALLNDVHILYYRPNNQIPALRLETTRGTASNRYQLSALLSAVQGQCQSARTMEPFPLFIADRMVKSLSPAMAAIIGLTTTEAGLQYSGPTGDIYHGLRSYRT